MKAVYLPGNKEVVVRDVDPPRHDLAHRYALLGKKAPTFVAWPIIPTTKANVLDSWKAFYHVDAPDNIRKSMKLALCTGTREALSPAPAASHPIRRYL